MAAEALFPPPYPSEGPNSIIRPPWLDIKDKKHGKVKMRNKKGEEERNNREGRTMELFSCREGIKATGHVCVVISNQCYISGTLEFLYDILVLLRARNWRRK